MGTPVNSYYNGGSSSPSTITATGLNSLANASAYSLGLISNINGSFEGAMIVRVYFTIVTSASPVAGDTISFYLLQGDNASNSTDGSTTSPGSITIGTASIASVIQISSGVTTYKGSFVIRNPGPQWGVAVSNNSGVSLASSGHSITYVTESIST